MQTQNNNSHYRNGSDTTESPLDLRGLRSDSNSVESEMPVAASAPTTSHRKHDLITRRRDRFGNRLGCFYHFDIPTIEDRPLAETALATAVERIRETQLIRADEIAHFYDEKLRPAFRLVLAVREEEEIRRADYNERARLSQAKADQEQQVLEAARDEATRPTHETIQGLDADLIAANEEARAKAARVGSAFDPQNPSPDCVLRHERRPLEVIAAEMALPWTPADMRDTMSARLAWITTAMIGGLIGLSIGLMTGMLPADNPTARPVMLGIVLMFGMAIAFLGKYALRLSGRDASQRYWLGRPFTNWAPSLLVALGVAVVILLADSYVEREGLLANVRLREMVANLSSGGAGGGGSHDTAFFLAAILMSFPYVVVNLWDGYLRGRHDACMNRVRARQEKEFAQADVERRADPQVHDALDAIVRVLDLLRHKGMLAARIGDIAAPFEEKIARAETTRLPEREGLDEHAAMRVQDALGNFYGAQKTFDRMFDEARWVCEPPAGFWRGLWRSLFGYRPPRSRGGSTRKTTH